MRTRVIVLAIVLVASFTVRAVAQRQPFLPLMLRIQEIPESGRVAASPCSDTNPQCSADIKSTLEIVPDLTRVPNRPPVVSIVDALDTQRRSYLNTALEALNASLALSKEIIARMSETPLNRAD